MAVRTYVALVLIFGCEFSMQAEKKIIDKQNSALIEPVEEKSDLKTAASTNHGHYYSGWGSNYPSGYGEYDMTGYGHVDDKYSSNYGGYGYDNNYLYGGQNGGYYPGYSSGYSGGNVGYGYGKGYDNYAGHGHSGYGNGGYGGYGGDGGINSYYGYNNPQYQGAYHLGYGYNKRTGYGNIYNSGITPSLVTGYRGYSRR